MLLTRGGDAAVLPTQQSTEVTLLRAAAPEPEPEPRDETEPETFVADVAPDARQPEPDTDVVAAANQQVEREQSAPTQLQREGPLVTPVPPSEAATPAPANRGEPLDTEVARLAPERSDPRPAPDLPFDDQGDRTTGSSDADGAEGAELPGRDIGQPDASSEQGAPGGLDLRAFSADSAATRQFVASASPAPPDSIQLEDGDRTLVNTRRVAYWSFFQRLTERVRQTWDPNSAWRRADPGYTEIERQEYVTIVDFALRTDGLIDHLEITRPSGMDALDREAIRALDAVVPVHNVPDALLAEDGRAWIRFYFNFDASGRTSGIRWLRR